MARRQIGEIDRDFTVKAGAQTNKQTGGNADTRPVDTDLDTIAGMRSALQTANAGRYTDDRLGNMTVNDLVFACRRESLAGAVLNAVQ